MAVIGRKKTELARVDPDFNRFIKNLCFEKSAQEREPIMSSRITQAMYKQYLKYPDLLNEIKRTKLGKWKPL